MLKIEREGRKRHSYARMDICDAAGSELSRLAKVTERFDPRILPSLFALKTDIQLSNIKTKRAVIHSSKQKLE